MSMAAFRSSRRICMVIGSLLAVCAPCLAQSSPSSGTTPFILDGNRIYAKPLLFVPTAVHRARVFRRVTN